MSTNFYKFSENFEIFNKVNDSLLENYSRYFLNILFNFFRNNFFTTISKDFTYNHLMYKGNRVPTYLPICGLYY